MSDERHRLSSAPFVVAASILALDAPAMTDLHTPLSLGPLHLQNRIFLAPLTRSRADEGHVPNDLMAQYYSQRASA